MKAILSTLLLFVFSCSNTISGQKADRITPKIEEGEVKRVIVFIGDGMGVGAISGTQYLADEKLQMLSMPEFGWMSTHSFEFVTTDSAASASAISSGEKTHFNGVGVRPGTSEEDEEDPAHHLESVFDLAKMKGWGRGVVSTSRVVHATPAAFYAHRKTRKSYEKIAEDLVNADLDVVLGAGWKYFRERKDRRDLSEDFKSKAYDYVQNAAELENYAQKSSKLIGLFYKKDMPFLEDEKRSISLADMVDSAIRVLDRGHPEGWVLMVEGSFIDWCEHSLRPNCTFKETKDFDEAIGVGRRYLDQRKSKDTLILVTADHETGGLSIVDPPFAEAFGKNLKGEKSEDRSRPVQHFAMGSYFNAEFGQIKDRRMTTAFGSMSAASALVWKKTGRFYAAHTAHFVPIFAQGPRAKFISQSRDNAALGQRIKAVIGNGKNGVKRPKVERPKNIVLLMGSGMGIPALTYGFYARGRSAAMDLTEHGIVAPQFSGRIIPDGVSTKAALTHTEQSDLISGAIEDGKSVGLITTGSVEKLGLMGEVGKMDQHSFLVNLSHKYNGKIDLIFGKGEPIEASKLRNQGYDLQSSWPPQKTEKPLVAIFSDPPSLAKRINFAVSQLEKNKSGYLLIVDVKGVDEGLRTFKRSGLLKEISDFDEALEKLKSERTMDTLILLTATFDHTMSVLDTHYAFVSGRCSAAKRCGGEYEYDELDVVDRDGFGRRDLQGEFPPKVILQYAWLVRAALHTSGYSTEKVLAYPSANFVPLFAEGPSAELFRGFHKQKEIGKILNSL